MTYSSSVAHQHTALLALPDRNMPPMEVDAAYQGCLPSCELHSRSFTVGRTGAGTYDLEIVHSWFMQSQGCTHVLCNLEIAHTCYAISRLPVQSNLRIPRMRNAISRLRKFPDCAEHIYMIINIMRGSARHEDECLMHMPGQLHLHELSFTLKS